MNPCVHHKKKLALLAAGVLENAERHTLQEHLLQCPRCRQYWQEITEICNEYSLATDSLPPLEVSDEFHRRLVRRIQIHERDPRRGALSRFVDWLADSRAKIAFSTAAVVLLALVVLQFRSKVGTANSISPISKPYLAELAKADSRPSFLSYRLAANKSLEALDARLAIEATRSSGSPGATSAFRREQAGLTD